METPQSVFFTSEGETPCPLAIISLFPAALALATTNLLSVCIDLGILDMSMESHIMCSFVIGFFHFALQGSYCSMY